MRILRAVEESHSETRVHRTPLESTTLSEAIDNYANARGLDPLTDREQGRVESVPGPAQQPLIPLVDALAFATRQRDEAFTGLEPAEQHELLVLAPKMTPGSTANVTAEEADRFRNLTEQVDRGRLIHAGRVLTGAVLDARDELSSLTETDLYTDDAGSEPPVGTERPREPESSEPREKTNRDRITLAADVLEARGGSSAEASPVSSGSLSSAITRMARLHFPDASVDPSVQGADRLDRLPPSLQESLTNVVDAYAGASAPGASSSGQAANVLRSLADDVGTLELWSLVLSLTPPDTHFKSPSEIRDRHAGLALAASGQTRSITESLRLSAYQSGLPGGQETPEIDPPPLSEAFDAWEAAFDVERTAEEEDKLLTTAEALPDHVAEALATLLWAQARAADMVDRLALSASQHDDLLDAARTVDRVLESGDVNPDDLGDLELFQDFTTRQAETGLRAGLLLAAATAQANGLLEKAPDEDSDPREFGRETVPEDPPRRPGQERPSAPGKPSSGAEPTGPYANPSRDIWFEDPSGLVLVTGEGETTYPERFLALTIDLGGDDIRPDSAGGITQDATQSFAISLDVGGDDRYVSDVPFAQGSAFATSSDTFPVGILADYNGDDTYQVRGFGQGASYQGGLGLLYDAGGDDRYTVSQTVPNAEPSFEIAGGQGYGYTGPGTVGATYPPALGVHADALGNDTYQAANGQGAAIGLVSPQLTILDVRTASGVLLETGGSETYTCTGVCLGKGRIGSLQGIECEGDEGEACANNVGNSFARERPGNVVAAGILVETDGEDDYRERGGPNNRVGPFSGGAHPGAERGAADLPLPEGIRVNQSTRIDVSLSDSNRDFVPDLVAEGLGYDPSEVGEGPVEEPYEEIDPHGLAVGRDGDGDGFSNELEQRLGTDPGDAGSAPVAPPTVATGNGADKLLDVRLDLTTGTAVTGGTVLSGRSPVAWVGLWPEATGEGPQDRVNTHNGLWSGNGLGTEGTSVALFGVGDTVATDWLEDYAVSIDLGGPDTYENNAGAASRVIQQQRGTPDAESGSFPGLALDLAGADTYTREDSVPSQGTGAYGDFGLLVDLQGDEIYEAERAAQGSAVGVNATGVLLDTEGDDVYEAEEAAQGFAGPECQTAGSTIGDAVCSDEEDCEPEGSGAGADACRTESAASRATALLLDVRGHDSYTSNGQGVLEANELGPDERICYLCPEGVSVQAVIGSNIPPSATPEAGPYTDAPSRSGLPAPANRPLDPTGDSATFIDLEGDDTYQVRGFREPVESQGYARGEGVPGQGSAAFLDLQGVDDYHQLPAPTSQADARAHEKNNHVYLNGVPATDEARRLVSLFLDAEHDPERVDTDGDHLPDLVESWLGTEPVDERHLDGEPPRDPLSRNPVEFDGFPSVNASRTIRTDTVLTLPRLGILVSGFGDAVHDESAALLVDLGGDDRYTAPVGTGVGDPYDTRDTLADVGVLLDVSGDDTYETHVVDPGDPTPQAFTGATQGAGVLGIGLHVDPQGEDLYNVSIETKLRSGAPGLGLSQGAAFQGVGVLVGSEHGTYRVNMTTNAPPEDVLNLGLAQGAAWGGLGLHLIHPNPIDGWVTRYNATAEPTNLPRAGAQGFAVEGAGLLVDVGPAPNRFEASGAAQGAASPHRLTTDEETPSSNSVPASRTGALGLLVSGAGPDNYRARSLAQGAAAGITGEAGLGNAWIGALVDSGGDDVYHLEPGSASSRPGKGQGTGIMGGMGVLVDRAGDDVYEAGANTFDVSAAQGSAWTDGEEALPVACANGCVGRPPSTTRGVLSDLDGHDRYSANGSLVHGSARAHVVTRGTIEASVSGASALLYDSSGDDVYEAPHAPGIGSTQVPPTAGAEPSLVGTGTFLDAAGADRYDPLPHPNVTVLEPADQATVTRDGLGNNEIWIHAIDTSNPADASASRLGVGVDAPSRATGIRTLVDDEIGDRGLSSTAVDVTVRETRGTAECGPSVGDDEAGGRLCLGANVSTPQGYSARIDEVRFYAISNRSKPSLVASLPGESGHVAQTDAGTGETRSTRDVTVFQTLWDSRPPAFPDGNTTVRAKVTFTPPDVHGRTGSRGHATIEDATALELDNPPWVTVDAPRWVNPEETPAIDMVVTAKGEEGTALPQIEIGHCEENKTISRLDKKPVSPEDPAHWTVEGVSLSDCPRGEDVLKRETGNVTIAGQVSDDDGNIGLVQPTLIGIDRQKPRIDLETPPAVNETVGRSGSFRVAWNVTETVSEVPFGRVDHVDVAVGVDGKEPQTWKPNAPSKGRALWEGFQHGGSVTVEVTSEDAAGNANVQRRTIPVDLEKPRLQDPGVEPRYVPSGEPAAFTINATDDGGIAQAFVEVAGDRQEMASDGEGGWVFDGFDEVTADLADDLGANASRPEGYPFRFVVEDEVGNRASTIEQQVFVDDVPPVVHDVRIEYPGGTAAGPGDLLKILVDAEDRIELADPLVAHVGNVSSTEQIPLHLDPATGSYAGTFVMDGEREAENASVRVVARDEAGNQDIASVPVHVATKAPSVSELSVSNRTATTATLTWSTDVPSTARVLVTNQRSEEVHRLTANQTTRDHELAVRNLSANTPYEVRLVPLNAAGDSGEARSLTFTTRTAIDLDVDRPAPESVHSGTLVAGWNATDPTGDPMTFTFHLRSTDREISIDRTLGTREASAGQHHQIELDTTRVSDGTWDLVVEAERGHDRATETVASIVVDNSAPVLRFESPEPGAVLSPGEHQLRLVALDRLSGVDADRVRVHDGDDARAAEPTGEGVFQGVVDVPSTEKHIVEVTARDQAGNLASEIVPFFVREGLDRGASVELDFPDGQEAVKPGDRVGIHFRPGGTADATDATLRPSDLTGPEPITFEAAPEGSTATFTVPPDAESGLTQLSVGVGGTSGSTERIPVDVPVDATDPTIESAATTMTAKSVAFLRVCANEPVTASVRASAPGARPSNATAPTPNPCHELRLGALSPGTGYEARVQALDGAGNAATTTVPVETEPDTQPPLPPENVEARVPTDHVVKLRWTEGRDDTGVDGYEVRRSPADADAWEAVGTTRSTEFVDRTAEAGHTYRYAVHTVDVAGNGSRSGAQVELTARGSPSLSDGAVTPERGTEAQTYTFTVNYTGPLTEATRVLVEIDGSRHEMQPVDDPDACWRGCTFQYETTLPAETLGGDGHSYRFTADANGFTTASPGTGQAEPGPIVTSTDGAFLGGTATVLGGALAGVVGVSGVALALLRRMGGGVL